jgi:hypothetical protein
MACIEEVRIEWRAPELALFLERFAQVVWTRRDIDRRDARFSFEHGHSFSSAIPSGLAHVPTDDKREMVSYL